MENFIRFYHKEIYVKLF